MLSENHLSKENFIKCPLILENKYLYKERILFKKQKTQISHPNKGL